MASSLGEHALTRTGSIAASFLTLLPLVYIVNIIFANALSCLISTTKYALHPSI